LRRNRTGQSNENHEAHFSVFRWSPGRKFNTIAPALTNGTTRKSTEEMTMWTKPEFTEMRFGFEVTMYIYNR
jgi:coenzyme PQQ precursor peptide PqqA